MINVGCPTLPSLDAVTTVVVLTGPVTVKAVVALDVPFEAVSASGPNVAGVVKVNEGVHVADPSPQL